MGVVSLSFYRFSTRLGQNETHTRHPIPGKTTQTDHKWERAFSRQAGSNRSRRGRAGPHQPASQASAPGRVPYGRWAPPAPPGSPDHTDPKQVVWDGRSLTTITTSREQSGTAPSTCLNSLTRGFLVHRAGVVGCRRPAIGDGSRRGAVTAYRPPPGSPLGPAGQTFGRYPVRAGWSARRMPWRLSRAEGSGRHRSESLMQ